MKLPKEHRVRQILKPLLQNLVSVNFIDMVYLLEMFLHVVIPFSGHRNERHSLAQCSHAGPCAAEGVLV